MVSLNCNDLLLLASESELLCQGSEGIKEVVLFDAVVKWKTYHNFCAYAISSKLFMEFPKAISMQEVLKSGFRHILQMLPHYL